MNNVEKVEKWPNIFYKSCRIYTARFFSMFVSIFVSIFFVSTFGHFPTLCMKGRLIHIRSMLHSYRNLSNNLKFTNQLPGFYDCYTGLKWIKFFIERFPETTLHTLESRINVPRRLLILEKNST